MPEKLDLARFLVRNRQEEIKNLERYLQSGRATEFRHHQIERNILYHKEALKQLRKRVEKLLG